MYETLCGKEEMSKAIDMGNFYRIPADMRDLNYTKYVQTGFSPGNDADMKRLARQIQANCENVEDYF